jgi:hypothetical protein
MTQINNPTTPPPVDPTLKAEITFCVQGVASPPLATTTIRQHSQGLPMSVRRTGNN